MSRLSVDKSHCAGICSGMPKNSIPKIANPTVAALRRRNETLEKDLEKAHERMAVLESEIRRVVEMHDMLDRVARNISKNKREQN
jgi:hypothetical protein